MANTNEQLISIFYNHDEGDSLSPNQVVEWVNMAIRSWGNWNDHVNLVTVAPVKTERMKLEVIKERG
jgi:hypothetical protein